MGSRDMARGQYARGRKTFTSHWDITFDLFTVETEYVPVPQQKLLHAIPVDDYKIKKIWYFQIGKHLIFERVPDLGKKKFNNSFFTWLI